MYASDDDRRRGSEGRRWLEEQKPARLWVDDGETKNGLPVRKPEFNDFLFELDERDSVAPS